MIKRTPSKTQPARMTNLDKENAGLRANVDRLQKEVDFVSKDRYALVSEKYVLQNKLGDFNSWPEFPFYKEKKLRVEYRRSDEAAKENASNEASHHEFSM